MRWNAERVGFAIAMAHAGVSRSKIATIMRSRYGEEVTKGSISGKLNRNPLYVRQPSPIGRSKADKEVTPRPKPCVAVRSACKPVYLPPSPADRIEPRIPGYRSDGSGCRFPLGDPHQGKFRLCEKPIAKITDVYCEACAARAYLPKPAKITVPKLAQAPLD